jgi:hypothetical protein
MKKLLKKLKNRLICKIKGHFWLVQWAYYNGMTHCKCKRCNKTKEDYIYEFL